jgi:hypothetical protein
MERDFKTFGKFSGRKAGRRVMAGRKLYLTS